MPLYQSPGSSPVALIMTVVNEGASMRTVLDSIAAQTRPPDTVVIVDGGSTDDTPAILQEYAARLPLSVIERPGCNISEGRNTAIAAVDAPAAVIAVTDAGTRLPADWLERITAPFADPAVQTAAGFFRADPHTPFEVAMGAAVLPLVDEIDPARFLPSSRSVAFRKGAWAAAGGYPEWLDYCEDLVLDLNLRALYGPFAWAPEACVAFRPRGSLPAYWRQYYRYARGDGKADLWRKRHAIRYATYLIGVPLILALGLAWGPLWWGLYLLGGAAYLRGAYRRLPAVWGFYRGERPPDWRDRLAAWLLIPVIRVVGDLAKMAGYPAGWRWRLAHHPPDWRARPGSSTSAR